MTIDNMNGFGGFVYIALAGLLLCAGTFFIGAFSHYFAKHFFIKFINKKLGKKKDGLIAIMYRNSVFHRVAYLIPAIILYHFAYLFNINTGGYKIYFADLIHLVAAVYVIVDSTLILTAILNCVHDRYNLLTIAKQRPIKSYLQVIKIILFIFAGIFIASVFFDQSPLYFLTGVSAATAVLLLVFKDSILGFVASIQLAAYDMLRIGDWIEMPAFGADGEVVDIALNTVMVQNFDKTIVTIPSYSLLTSGVKNWRGMKESGGRRVKRAINIDMTSIKICDENLLQNLQQLVPFKDQDLSVGQITNIGLFRHYLNGYLRQHPRVHQQMKMIIRQLQATATGLPLELYFFANEIDSEKYESIQADIFDHVYAMLPLFKLRMFQYASGSDEE